MKLIDLDELIYGNPTMDQVRDFFQMGDFHEEHYKVMAIRRHLRTQEHRRIMFEYDFTIEDMLNGRIEYNSAASTAADGIRGDWNAQLGFVNFT